uniref:Uncharacterized protein n=1 Tax=Panagrolaimus sp. PS1159 TaxID=55785 RepID=A0AC35GPX4_9BILA
MVKWQETLTEWRHSLFPKLTTTSLIRHYIPIGGAISHTLHSAVVSSPKLLPRIFPLYDIAIENTLLFNSHVGAGLYVFFRPHLHKLNNWDRVEFIEFSVLASVIFNFGSLLFVLLIKQHLPEKFGTAARSLIGAGVSMFLISRSLKYLRHIDFRSNLSAILNDSKSRLSVPLSS